MFILIDKSILSQSLINLLFIRTYICVCIYSNDEVKEYILINIRIIYRHKYDVHTPSRKF